MIEQSVLHLAFIFVRVTSFLSFFPVFSGRRLSRMVKVALAIHLAVVCIGDAMPLESQLEGKSWIVLSILAMREIVLGAGFGIAFGLLIEPARMAGAYVGREMGLTLASVADPTSGAPVAIMGQLFEWITVVLLFALNLHHVLLHAIKLSLAGIRIGERSLVLPAIELFRQTDLSHQWSFLIIAPLGVVLFLALLSMGFLARAVPQMNIFAVGFALRILVGLGGLLVFAPAILHMIARSLEQSGSVLNMF